MIHVSAGIIRNKAGEILIARRGEGRKNAHLWEFPGGKQENGESAADCLRRELLEELSLPVGEIRTVCTGEAQGIAFDFLTAETDAQPVATEHEALAFVPAAKLADYAFCPADGPVARRIAMGAKPIRHYFWDFDGTLMDSYPMMHRHLMASIHDNGGEADPARVLELMMVSIPHCCEVMGAELGISPEALRLGYRAHKADPDDYDIRPFEGIEELLHTLVERGGHHYLYTHRDESVWKYLKQYGMADIFEDSVISTDGFPAKPAPDALQHLMAKHGLDPETCVMIGDRVLDPQSGLNAGMHGLLWDIKSRFTAAGLPWTVTSVAEMAAELTAEPIILED